MMYDTHRSRARPLNLCKVHPCPIYEKCHPYQIYEKFTSFRVSGYSGGCGYRKPDHLSVMVAPLCRRTVSSPRHQQSSYHTVSHCRLLPEVVTTTTTTIKQHSMLVLIHHYYNYHHTCVFKFHSLPQQESKCIGTRGCHSDCSHRRMKSLLHDACRPVCLLCHNGNGWVQRTSHLMCVFHNPTPFTIAEMLTTAMPSSTTTTTSSSSTTCYSYRFSSSLLWAIYSERRRRES